MRYGLIRPHETAVNNNKTEITKRTLVHGCFFEMHIIDLQLVVVLSMHCSNRRITHNRRCYSIDYGMALVR